MIALIGGFYMPFRRFFVSAFVRALQNPAVQKKVSVVAGKALNRARPALLRASREAGELTRKATKKILDKK